MYESSTIAQEYSQKMQIIEDYIINLFDGENSDSQDYLKIKDLMKNIKNDYKQQDLREIAYLLVNIAKNHYRTQDFINKIWDIFQQIIQDLGNLDLFQIFKDHKLLLLFLFQNKIIIPTKLMLVEFSNDKYKKSKYLYYFFPEFRHFFKQRYNPFFRDSISCSFSEYHNCRDFFESAENYEVKRKIGENDSYICGLIRNDSVEDFIVYVNKNNINLSKKVDDSVFETNPFLLENQPTLIDYAAFYGSRQIFQYLLLNNANLNQSISLYAIHGKNPEIIHLLEENRIKFDNVECCIEAIKCHHHDISNYIKNQLNEKKENNIIFLISCLIYYNFTELSFDCLNSIDQFTIFKILVQYDYSYLAKLFNTRNNKDHDKMKELILCAIDNNNSEIFKLFIDDIDINEKIYEYKKDKILHIAVNKGKIDIVKVLLEPPINADINQLMHVREGDGYGGKGYGDGVKNPLHIAIQNEDVKMVEFLIKNDKININSMFIQEIITNKGLNHDVRELTPLFMAVENENINIIKLLLSHKDIDVNSMSLLVFYFIDGYHYPICNSTKKYRKDEEEDDDECGKYFNKIFKRKNDFEEKYVEVYNRDPEETRWYRAGGAKTPLFAAIELENISIIKHLLSHPAIDVNARSICYHTRTKQHITPLYAAINLKNDEIEKLLLSNEQIDIHKLSGFYVESKDSRKNDSRIRIFELKDKRPPHYARGYINK